MDISETELMKRLIRKYPCQASCEVDDMETEIKEEIRLADLTDKMGEEERADIFEHATVDIYRRIGETKYALNRLFEELGRHLSHNNHAEYDDEDEDDEERTIELNEGM